MKPLAIEFARARAPAGSFNRGALLVGMMAIALALWNYLGTRSELLRAVADNQAAALAVARSTAAPATSAVTLIPEAQVRAINTAIAQLNLPWAPLFEALETAKPDAVALIALEPDARKRTLVVQAETKNPAQMIKFAEGMRRLPIFEEAVLTKHEIQEQDVNHPYRFTLELRWRDDL